MPPSNYSEDELLKTKLEKFVPTPLILDYCLRKLNLAFIVTLLWVARQVSRPYGFDFSASVSDRDSWKWKPYKKLPLYHARLERVD